MMAEQKGKNRGGRRSKSGAPARPQLRDPKTGRKYKDTPTNRVKLGIPLMGDAPPIPAVSPPPSKHPSESYPASAAPQSQGGGHTAGTAAVVGSLGLNEPNKSAQSPAPATPETPQVSYIQLVKIGNMILKPKVPEAAMLPEEEQQIGAGLDGVIAKHFPAMKDFGVEFALALAISAWVTRAILPILMAPPADEVPDASPRPFGTVPEQDFGPSEL